MSSPLWPSLPLLKAASDKYFLKATGQLPWLPCMNLSLPEKSLPVTDIVFSGRLFDEIPEYQSWPGKYFRLWALGSASRDIRISAFKMNESHLSFLPRYELFAAGNPRPFPLPDESFTLVYSGRIREDKGISYFLKIASSLQNKFKLKIRPVVFGVLDQSTSSETSLQNKRIKELLGSLPWTIRPEMYVGLSPDEWVKAPLENPVLFNFSVFLNEDFGVSIAQAQSMGWPVLLSDWGGHKDVTGTNVRRFPVRRLWILNSLPMDVDQDASLIVKAMQSPATPDINRKSLVPEPVSSEELSRYTQAIRDAGIISGKSFPANIDAEIEAIFSGPGNLTVK